MKVEPVQLDDKIFQPLLVLKLFKDQNNCYFCEVRTENEIFWTSTYSTVLEAFEEAWQRRSRLV